jgi:hypothetical protein
VVEELRGLGAPVVKSALGAPESAQPARPRSAAIVSPKRGAEAPAQLVEPYATTSTTEPPGAGQADDTVPPFETSATFPLVELRLMAPVASGEGRLICSPDVPPDSMTRK